jgi:dipeptidyl-peptidase-4
MRIILLFLFCAFTHSIAEKHKELTLADIYQSDKFQTKNIRLMRWMPDSKGFLYVKKENGQNNIYHHRVSSGEESIWLKGEKLIDSRNNRAIHFIDYQFSPSGKQIVFKADAKRVWRRFDDAKYYVYSIAQKSLTPIYGGEERIRHAKLSPNEQLAGYVLKNNIYIKNLQTDVTTQITNDGNEEILNGLSDWVYEEEFSKADRWHWLNGGNAIAFYQFDQSNVKRFSWAEYDGNYGQIKTIPYPKAGEENSKIKIGVYHLKSKKTVWMDLGNESDIYIPRIYPAKDGNLLTFRLNRLQNKLDIIHHNIQTGTAKILYTEKDKAWISIYDDFIWMEHENSFIKTSEESGYRHIWKYNVGQKQKTQITHGEFEVTDIYGITNDEKIYFQTNKGKVKNRHIYCWDISRNELSKISTKSGTNAANFSPDMSILINRFSNVSAPLQVELLSNKGENIRSLLKNDNKELNEYGMVYPEFISFKTEDGVQIKAMITKPKNFNPAQKYPVLIYGYSGPASQLVRNVWGRRGLWNTYLTQKGYIVFTIDQRGTGGRGKAFKNLAYGDIGKYMLKDHIEGVKYLRKLNFVDGDRIGIWGWSGGGYLALMAMTKGSEYFKMGIAVAPVTDFRLYDNIWSERYMGLPQNNAAGYDSSSVFSYIDRYKGGLLLIHGSADDNVHFQNSMQFAEKMQNMGKTFDMMVYADKNHSMLGKGNVYYHLFSLMTKYILENL